MSTKVECTEEMYQAFKAAAFGPESDGETTADAFKNALEIVIMMAFRAKAAKADERATFEEWAVGEGIGVERTPTGLMLYGGQRREPGDYITNEALCSYGAWLARGALEVPDES